MRKSLQQIKALLAWEQLKHSEARPGRSLMLAFDNSIETDLRNEYSYFLSTCVQLHSVLNDSSIIVSEEKRQNIKRQLATIEQQIYSLNLHQRFLKC